MEKKKFFTDESLGTLIDEIKAYTDTASLKDWNQNDTNASDYIQNRTHWEAPEHVVFVDNLTYAEWARGNYPECVFVPGQQYQVTWNGTVYETTCHSEDGYNILGDDNCPFSIDDDGGYGLYVSTDDDDWTLSIATTQVVVHHLDPKYIKDMYYEEVTEYPEEVILSETLDFTSEKQYMGSPTGKILEGVEYTVLFNGTEYDVTGTYSEEMGIVYLGNVDLLLGNNPEVGLPFAIGEGSGIFGIFVMRNGNHEITIKIKAQTSTVIHKVPEKYLPEAKPETYNAGKQTEAKGAEIFNNYVNNTATGQYSHAEGWNTHASGEEAHAEGLGTYAEGAISHAEGIDTYATGDYSHAEGYASKASGEISHAEGHDTEARGQHSHAEGNQTIAGSKDQHVQGRFNIVDSNNKYADIIGNGDSDSVRSNAATVDWNGNAEFQGDVKANACGGAEPISLVELWNEVEAIDSLYTGDDVVESAVPINADTLNGYTAEELMANSGSGSTVGGGINFINSLNALGHDDIIEEAKNGMSLLFEPTQSFGTTEVIPVKWIVTGGIDECGDNISGFAFCVPLDVIYVDDGCGDPHMDALFTTIVTGAEANSIRAAWLGRSIN